MNNLNINKVNFWEINFQKFNNKVFNTSEISSNGYYYPKTKKRVTNENFSNPTFFQSIGRKGLMFPDIGKMPNEKNVITFKRSFYSSYFRVPLFFSSKEIEKAKDALSKATIEALKQVMKKDYKEFKGIWYPGSLKKFFASSEKKMPEDYWSGYANPEFFEKSGHFEFKLKKGKAPSEAIKAIIKGPSVLDCGNATQVAYYKAVLDFLGPEKFNAFFSKGRLLLKITQKGIMDTESPICLFSKWTQTSEKKLKGSLGRRPISTGEGCFFRGIEWYLNKHPRGAGSGWNVICAGENENKEQLFVGHGFKKPLTERKINKLLIKGYNSKRTVEDKEYISKANLPKFYDKSINYFLKNHYTVPLSAADEMVKGFSASTAKSLDPFLLLRAKKERIDELFKCNLIFRKFHR